MDQQTFELLRVLQSGERNEIGLAQVRSLLDPQRRALHAADDRASLSDISELLEVWAESAPPPQAAAAIAHAGQIAEQDLEQAERAVQLYVGSLERDPSQTKVIDQLDGLLKQLKQRERLDPVLVKAAAALRAQGDAGADAAATILRRLGQLRLQLGTGIDGAVSAYEQALELSAEVELIRELAELYAKRNADGDARQAADLYATLAEVLGEKAGTSLLERALDLVPGHLEALVLLESFVPKARHAERLTLRWAAFVRDSDDAAATAQRRLLLGRAATKRGDHHAALEWIAPNAEQGDNEALELQAGALAALAQADGADVGADDDAPTTLSKIAGPIRPATLVGFRVPVGSRTTEAEQANAPGARKPRKARSGDTMVGFRVPEALAATAAERAAHSASAQPNAAADPARGAAASKAAALKPAANAAKPAGAKPTSAKPVAAASSSKPGNAGAIEPKRASAPAASHPAARTSAGASAPAKSARPAKVETAVPARSSKPAASQPAIGARAGNGVSATAPISPAQRSAALRTGGSATPAPAARAASTAVAAQASPAAALAAALRASSPAVPAVSAPAAFAQSPAPVAIAQSPAAALASSLQTRASSAPPALVPRLSHMSGAAPGLAAQAQALSSAVAPAQAHALSPAPMPLPVAMPAPRASESRDDELSGVRTRPQLLDKRTLAIGGAVLLGVIGAVALLRAKPAPAPPAASADAVHAVEVPPPTAASSATTTTTATGTATVPSAAAAPTAGAALPSALAAAITPPVTTAPAAAVAPEPTPGRVEVQVSEIRVRGGKLRTKDVLTALGAGLKDVEHCYEEVLEDRPRTAGALNYSFTVDRKGNPTKVKKSGGTIKDSRLLKCTQRAIEKADFPKPKSKPAQVTLPLEFKKG